MKQSSFQLLYIVTIACLFTVILGRCTDSNNRASETLGASDTMYYLDSYDSATTLNDPRFDLSTQGYTYQLDLRTFPTSPGEGKPMREMVDSICFEAHLCYQGQDSSCKLVMFDDQNSLFSGSNGHGFSEKKYPRRPHPLNSSICNAFPFRITFSDDSDLDRLTTGGGLIVILEPMLTDPYRLKIINLKAWKAGDTIPTKRE